MLITLSAATTTLILNPPTDNPHQIYHSLFFLDLLATTLICVLLSGPGLVDVFVVHHAFLTLAALIPALKSGFFTGMDARTVLGNLAVVVGFAVITKGLDFKV
jgi:hypothetical protein